MVDVGLSANVLDYSSNVRAGSFLQIELNGIQP